MDEDKTRTVKTTSRVWTWDADLDTDAEAEGDAWVRGTGIQTLRHARMLASTSETTPTINNEVMVGHPVGNATGGGGCKFADSHPIDQTKERLP